MAVSIPRPVSSLLTYESYLAEGIVEGRYEIIDGVRYTMPGASWLHQKLVLKIARLLEDFQKESHAGETMIAPFDVLIHRNPLRTRQPDILFISHNRLAEGGGVPERGSLEVSPELVIEIISDSETERSIDAKLADYAEIAVAEVWLVHSQTRSVEVLRWSQEGFRTGLAYDAEQTIQSLAFPGLEVSVADLF